ncbi:hypothetical protein [Actinomadura harenae]|nr:hypothetical protein [Actinomadura harenae]
MTVPREDLAAGLAARRELGPDYDAAFADVIAARIEEQLAARTSASAEFRPAPLPRAPRPLRDHSLTLILVSLVASIPLTAISGYAAGSAGVFLVWLALVALNVTYMHRPRRD